MEAENSKPMENGCAEGVIESDNTEEVKEEWLDVLGSGQIKKKVLSILFDLGPEAEECVDFSMQTVMLIA